MTSSVASTASGMGDAALDYGRPEAARIEGDAIIIEQNGP